MRLSKLSAQLATACALSTGLLWGAPAQAQRLVVTLAGALAAATGLEYPHPVAPAREIGGEQLQHAAHQRRPNEDELTGEPFTSRCGLF